MKKEKPQLEEPSAPFWMLTFSDMVTLLLVFFILILSYSTVELQKFKGAMSSMKGALGVMPEMDNPMKKSKSDVTEKLTTKQQFLDRKAKDLENLIIENDLENDVFIEPTTSGIRVLLGDNILFDVAKAEIKPAAFPILSGIAQSLREELADVYVEGHSDNVPIHTYRYPTNWELSQARALSVVRYLHDQGNIPYSKLAAVGHGEHRPLAPNDTPANRAKNRRVEIYIRWD